MVWLNEDGDPGGRVIERDGNGGNVVVGVMGQALRGQMGFQGEGRRQDERGCLGA